MRNTIYYFIFLGMVSCSWFKNYPEDNLAEEIVEGAIKYETGIDVDLSPGSPEN